MNQKTHCPHCGQQLTDQEIKENECWNCIAKTVEADGPTEWDTDDDEAMPNTIKR